MTNRQTASRLDLRRLRALLNRFAEVRLLVVGDVVLDEYLSGDVERVSPEAPVPVVHVQDESAVLGGAGNVVRNIVALGGQCGFCSVIGKDPDGDQVVELLEELEVEASGVLRLADRPTTRKTRIVGRSQQIVRVDRETRDPIPAEAIGRHVGAVEARLSGLDGAVVEDYGKGLLTPKSIRRVMARFADAKVPVCVDPKGELRPFRGADVLKPNLREAESLAGVSLRDGGGLEQIAKRIQRAVGPANLAITRGHEGMTLFDAAGKRRDVPTLSQEVYDVQGAGDTTIAILAMARGAGASLVEAAVLANAGAGVVVEKMGTATASRDEIGERLPDALRAAREGSS